MKLLTSVVTEALPPLYSQEHVADPIVPIKFFTPWMGWTWYAYEGSFVNDHGDRIADPTAHDQAADYLCFGVVDGFEREYGYFSLNELQSVKGPLGIGIERDLYWKPKPLSAIEQ